jgi:hypothetical protein
MLAVGNIAKNKKIMDWFLLSYLVAETDKETDQHIKGVA